MFEKKARWVMVLVLSLAVCGGLAQAQSIRNQGPATSQSQNYATPGQHGVSLLGLVLSIALVATLSAGAGYYVTHRQS